MYEKSNLGIVRHPYITLSRETFDDFSVIVQDRFQSLTSVHLLVVTAYVANSSNEKITSTVVHEKLSKLFKGITENEKKKIIAYFNTPRKYIAYTPLRQKVDDHDAIYIQVPLVFLGDSARIGTALKVPDKLSPPLISISAILPKNDKFIFDFLLTSIEAIVNESYSSMIIQNVIEAVRTNESNLGGAHAFDDLQLFLSSVKFNIPDIDFVVWIYYPDYDALISDVSSVEDLWADVSPHRDYAWISYSKGVQFNVPDLKKYQSFEIEEEPECFDQYMKRGWKSAAFWPIFVGGKVRGTIGVFRKKRGQIPQGYEVFIEIVRAQAVRYVSEADQLEEYAALRDRIKSLMPLMAIGRESAQRMHDIRDNINKLKDVFIQIRSHTEDLKSSKEHSRLVTNGLEFLDEIKMILSKQLETFRQAREKTRKTDIVKFLKGLKDSLLFNASSEGVRFDLSVPNKEIYCNIQAFYFERAIENLVSNGIYFAKQRLESGEFFVQVTLVEQENQVMISVLDSGPGIDPEDEERIFEEGMTTKTDGFGVGLSIVRSIIEDHKGKISIAKDEKHGALITISIPKYAE